MEDVRVLCHQWQALALMVDAAEAREWQQVERCDEIRCGSAPAASATRDLRLAGAATGGTPSGSPLRCAFTLRDEGAGPAQPGVQ